MSPELGHGVFAEFLRLGLGGRADGFTGEVDKQVQAVELVTYARAWVIHWLKKHKVPVVAPVLYGSGKDFILRSVPQDLPPWPEAVAAAATPEEVMKAWKTVEDWRNDGAVHKYPRTFRQLQETVARIDQAAAGGGRWESLAINLRDRMKPVLAQRTALDPKRYPLSTVGRLERLASPRSGDPPPPVPAKAPEPKGAEAKAPDPKGPDFAVEIRKLQDALRIANRAAGTREKPAEPKAAEEAKGALAKAQAAFIAAPPELQPYDRTVATLFKDLTTSDGTERVRENLEQYLKTLRDLPNPPGHLELAYLALVQDPTIEERRQWPPALPRFLLSAAVAGEEAVVVNGRGLLRMTTKQGDELPLGDAEQKYLDGLKALFVANESKWNQAARAFGDLEPMYRNLAALGAAHAAAVREWELGVALLVAVGDFAPTTSSAGEDSFEKRWDNLRNAVGNLRRAIDRQDPMDKLTRATDDAQKAYGELEPMLRPTPGGEPVEGRARLRLALWRPEDRQKWTADTDTAALALAAEALADKTVKAAGDVRKPVTDEAFHQAAGRRAKRAKALLTLVDSKAAPDGLTGWRTALADQLIARYQEAGSKPPLDRAADREKFAWLIHPADRSATPEGENPAADPAADLRLETDRAAARWLLDNRYGRIAAEMEKMADKPAAATKLAETLTRAVQPLTSWP